MVATRKKTAIGNQFNLFTPPQNTGTDRAFALYKFWITYPGDSLSEALIPFQVSNGLSLSEQEASALLRQAGMFSARCLMAGGFIRDERLLNYASFEEYEKAIKTIRVEDRNRLQQQWIDNRPARRIWTGTPAKNKAVTQAEELKERAIAVVEEYYQGFTPQSVRNALIQVSERNYGGERREGILVKEEPYAQQYTIIVRGILGNHTVYNEGKGWKLQLEADAQIFSIKKRYRSLPTPAELIDDLCLFDYLETLPPVGWIVTDTGRFPIFPTASDLFTTGYTAFPDGEKSYRIEPVDLPTQQLAYGAFLNVCVAKGYRSPNLGVNNRIEAINEPKNGA